MTDEKTELTEERDALVVPMQLEAWVVNDDVLKSSQTHPEKVIRRWDLDYSQLSNFASPEHTPFDSETSRPSEGVYVHWTLPKSLRHAVQAVDAANNPTSSMQFPLVPNRWLIVRYSGPSQSRSANAWIIESDHIGDENGSAFPTSTQVGQTTIGRCIPLASWHEGSATAPLFLTAAASGDVHFSMFQSYNENVFSFRDDLSTTPDDTYSYLVTGWYSNPQYDSLAQCQTTTTLQAQLDALQWCTTTTTLVSQTLFQGMVCDITNVNADSKAPLSPQDSNGIADIKIAVGSNALEALNALVTAQNKDASTPLVPKILLDALNTGLLDKLEDSDAEETIATQLHEAEFSHQSGGTLWFVSAPENQASDTTSSVLDLPADLAQQLDDLNTNQQILEQQQTNLQKLQWDLYALWWKQGNGEQQQGLFPDPRLSSILERIPPNFDLNDSTSLASQIQTLQTTVSEQQQSVSAAKDTLTTALDKYNLILKKSNTSPMWSPKDPVVIITGITQPDTSESTQQSLPCRYLDQCTSNIQAAPSPDNFPANLENLLKEFYCIDTKQTNLLTGPAPYFGLTPWQQPFSPFFMEWEVNWFNLPFSNWTYTGQGYQLTGLPKQLPSQQTLKNISLLTPHASFAFKGQLQRLIDQDPSFKSEFHNWEAIEQSINDWQILALSLNGFHQQLVQQDINMHRAPTASDNAPIDFRTLIADQAHNAPIPGLSSPYFQPVRHGQFWFNHLTIVDRFGQTIEVIQPDPQQGVISSNCASVYQPFVSDSLKPDIPAEPTNPLRFMQLAPRVVQSMRLKADWLLANDDSNKKPLQTNCQANPIAGWMLPNYINQSFQFFDPSGGHLGELFLIESTEGQKRCHWQTAYQSSYSNIEGIKSIYPWVGDFVLSFVSDDPSVRIADPVGAYHALRDIIDLALTTKTHAYPSYTTYLTALVGPIFALARASWQLELAQPAYQDQSWAATCEPNPQVYQAYSVPIQLGSTDLNTDGLIGYFQKTFGQFYSLYQPTTANGYIKDTAQNRFPLTPSDRGNQMPAFTTVLMNPFAKVHAHSDILPTQTLQLPDIFVKPALDNINVTFRQGPSLTKQPSPTASDTSIEYMIPAAKGRWSWLAPQKDGSTAEVNLKNASTGAHFTGQPRIIIQGLLRWTQFQKTHYLESKTSAPEDHQSINEYKA
ncbi:MAG: hypothetical protein NXI01_09710 [Gammaproteobacteria bacterium]|nr:hypothetical protein [Gammaproteobacteria bacterium]